MARAPLKKLNTTSYHVAWICPVADLEVMPALLMLDEEHERPDIDNNPDETLYRYGSVAGHNVVLATCRQGMTGNVNASSVSGPLFTTFLNIRMTLLVGIGGGVPQPDSFFDPLNDLRLGDVVVGWPTSADRRGSVVYYDYGKALVDQFEMIGSMDKPHKIILNALPSLKTDHELGRSTFHHHMAKLQSNNLVGARFKHPGLDHDILFQPHSKHIGGYNSNCKGCKRDELVERGLREDSQKDIFIYHQGRIATGNSVMMDGEKRDSISAQCGGALCIEMEAAGVEVNGRCLVIRGIADYADSHKSDRWRSYAAGKAAAFARELLGKIPARDVKEKMAATENKHWLVDRPTNPNFTGRRRIVNKIIERVTSGDAKNKQRRFVLTGVGGQGKSEICLHVANKVRDRFWGIFWLDVSTTTSANESFSEVAEALGCQKTVDAVRIALCSLPATENWLLILDNADDTRTDYHAYFPSGNRGAVILTSRNSQCAFLATAGDHEELGSLEQPESLELLCRTSRLSEESFFGDYKQYTVPLVEDLEHHPLSILLAGSCMANTNAHIAMYSGFLWNPIDKPTRKRPRGVGESQYDTVYRIIEASMVHLEHKLSGKGRSDQRYKDSLQLLETLSTFHYISIPLDVLVDAWTGIKVVLSTPQELQTYSDRLTAWHVAQVPKFVSKEPNDVRFRINEALEWLESLALVRTDQSAHPWKSVSMHPLVHSWAGDPQSHGGREKKTRKAECIISLSEFAFEGSLESWPPYYHRLMLHLKLLVESDMTLVDDAVQSRCVLQICVQIAWIFRRMGLRRELYELTGRIFQRMGLIDKQPTQELRGLYCVFAEAVASEGSRQQQADQLFEAIKRLDEKIRGETDWERQQSLRDLSSGPSGVAEGQRTETARDSVEGVFPTREVTSGDSRPREGFRAKFSGLFSTASGSRLRKDKNDQAGRNK